MATLDITSSTKNNFKVRVEYTAGGGVISITNIGGCRTDNFDSASQNSQNRVNINIGGNSTSAVPSNNTIRFTRNNNFSYWGTGHYVSGLSGNTSISISIYAPSNSTINGLTFNATINAGTSATAPTGVWCNITGVIEEAVSLNGGYSSDGGSSITMSGYQYRRYDSQTWTNCYSYIDGLTANTTYYFRYYAGNAIGTTYSSEVSATTVDYPKPTSTNNFTIGAGEGTSGVNDGASVFVSNPLGRTYTLEIISKNSNTTIGSYTGSYNGYITIELRTPANQALQYASIPNSKTGNYYAKVTLGNSVKNYDINSTYSIKNDGSEVPNFSDSNWSYSADLTSLTNNNQCVINGYSTITYTVGTAATSNYYATISKYNYKWGNATTESTSGSTVTGGNSNILSVEAVDSRGLLKSTSKTLTTGENYVPYTIPTLDYSHTQTRRVDGITATTYLNIKGKLSVTKFGTSGEDNELYSVKYKVYNYSTSTWTSQFTIPTSGFTLASDGTFTLNDYQIHADGSSGGFAIGTKYAIQLEIKDAGGLLGTLTSNNILVTDGKIAVDCYQDSNGDYHRGINGLANDSYSETIHGDINVTGDYYKNGNALNIPEVNNSYNTSSSNTYSCDYINKKTANNIAEAYYTSNITINQEWVTPSFGGNFGYGDKLELRNGRIYVKAGVTAVKVSAIAFLENMGADHIGYVWMHIQKNGGGISTSITSGSSGYYESISCPELITGVNEGDYFTLSFNNSSYTSGNYPIVRGWGDNTRLFVEVVE